MSWGQAFSSFDMQQGSRDTPVKSRTSFLPDLHIPLDFRCSASIGVFSESRPTSKPLP
ncbi:hypothetical protein [Caenibius sp. WL]|uniref:hypothetical protein n=1 Tax=Caenibius sp. WL TaxID=2872646 RepID=UPI001C99D900|nr:hypothetical protein [Caenibius sp. WL]QZP09129.1 hypothetical protein K5X80_05005 [Caenibius sp. WL]